MSVIDGQRSHGSILNQLPVVMKLQSPHRAHREAHSVYSSIESLGHTNLQGPYPHSSAEIASPVTASANHLASAIASFSLLAGIMVVQVCKKAAKYFSLLNLSPRPRYLETIGQQLVDGVAVLERHL
jgi:hypothetical protein